MHLKFYEINNMSPVILIYHQTLHSSVKRKSMTLFLSIMCLFDNECVLPGENTRWSFLGSKFLVNGWKVKFLELYNKTFFTFSHFFWGTAGYMYQHSHKYYLNMEVENSSKQTSGLYRHACVISSTFLNESVLITACTCKCSHNHHWHWFRLFTYMYIITDLCGRCYYTNNYSTVDVFCLGFCQIHNWLFVSISIIIYHK